MKIAGQLMLPAEGKAVRLAPGAVEVADGRITRVTEGDIPSDADLGSEHHLICPGFIDAHVHLPQFNIIGAHGLTLLDWLDKHTFPAEAAWADAPLAKGESERAIRRMLAAGTTGFAAFATVHAEATRAALDSAKSLGVRAWIGQVLMDRQAPEQLCRPADQLLNETQALLTDYPAAQDGLPTARVSASVNPRFAPTCSEPLLQGAGQLALDHPCLVHTHLAETLDECDKVASLFAGRRYLKVYEQARLLTKRSIFAHGIHLSDADRDALAKAGATLAHCPTANRFLMSGRLDWSRCRHVPFALGSDIGAGYEVSMPRVARAMLNTAGDLRIDEPSRGTQTLPTAAQAWWQITRGNSQALHWHDAGVLAEGAPADVVVCQPTINFHYNSEIEPLARLLWSWDDRWIEQVLLGN